MTATHSVRVSTDGGHSLCVRLQVAGVRIRLLMRLHGRFRRSRHLCRRWDQIRIRIRAQKVSCGVSVHIPRGTRVCLLLYQVATGRKACRACPRQLVNLGCFHGGLFNVVPSC